MEAPERLIQPVDLTLTQTEPIAPTTTVQYHFSRESIGTAPTTSKSGVAWQEYVSLLSQLGRTYDPPGAPVGYTPEDIVELRAIGNLLKLLARNSLSPVTEQEAAFVAALRTADTEHHEAMLWRKCAKQESEIMSKYTESKTLRRKKSDSDDLQRLRARVNHANAKSASQSDYDRLKENDRYHP